MKKLIPDDPDLPWHLKENKEVIVNVKEKILKILQGLIKAGINVEKSIYPRLPHKNLYLGPDSDSEGEEQKHEVE